MRYGVEIIKLNSLDAEQAVLGIILRWNDSFADLYERCPGTEYFYQVKHQLLYSACIALFKEDKPCDNVSVASELDKAGDLMAIGGRSYLFDLIEGVATKTNMPYHCQILEDMLRLRNLQKMSEGVLTDLRDKIDPTQAIENAEKALYSLSVDDSKAKVAHISELMQEARDDLDKTTPDGFPTGLRAVDEIAFGLQRGDYAVLAGRPSMGKTAMALCIALNMAKRGVPVLFISLEMGKASIANRLLSTASGVNGEKIRLRKLEEEDFQKLGAVSVEMEDLPLYIEYSGSMTPTQLRSLVRRFKAQRRADVVMVDYLQLMSGGRGFRGDRVGEFTVISSELKRCAKDMDIALLALSQLSRGVEQRGKDKRPMLSDLRESGAIEQDADLVMMCYRPEYYISEEDMNKSIQAQSLKGRGECIIAKHRNGPTGTAFLRWIANTATWEDKEIYVY